MQFNLQQLLLAFAGISLIGYAIANGIAVAIVFAILASMAIICIVRIVKGWETFGFLKRTYTSVCLVTSACLLIFFMTTIAISPSFATDRLARSLRYSLMGKPQFAKITIASYNMKIDFVRVAGTVETESEFSRLKSVVDRNTSADMLISWDVTVSKSAKHYHGWDSALFPSEGQ